MLTETRRGGVDSRTHVGVSRELRLSKTPLSSAPDFPSPTPEDRGTRPLLRRATARAQTGLSPETYVVGLAFRRLIIFMTKGARHVTRP